MKNCNYLLSVFCLCVSTQVAAAEKQEMVQHGSHEHGVARLTVATTDDGLEIALESPAANLFGFEHTAKTDEEREVVHEAVEKLELGSSLFSINDVAGCAFDSAVVESGMDDDHDDHKDEKHSDKKEHDDHKHEKHSDKEDHDDHKHEKHSDKKEHDDHKDEKHSGKEEHDDHKDEKHSDKEEHDDEEKSHSDVDVTWAFKCEKPAAIESVSTKLFSAFPNGFEEIAVEWITASSAGKIELEKDGTITLKQ